MAQLASWSYARFQAESELKSQVGPECGKSAAQVVKCCNDGEMQMMCQMKQVDNGRRSTTK